MAIKAIAANPGHITRPSACCDCLAEMAKKFPIHPKHPERICWGCDKYCSVDSLACGNGSGRTQHPMEVLGEDWYKYGDWGLDLEDEVPKPPET